MGVYLLETLWKLYPENCQWSSTPYEYVTDHLPIDVIAGTDQFRKAVEAGKVKSFLEKSKKDVLKFTKDSMAYYLY